MVELNLYPSGRTPTNPAEDDLTSSRALGTTFYSSIPTYIVGARWRSPNIGFPPSAKMSLWSLTGDVADANTGARIVTKPIDFTGYTPGDWITVRWDAPIALPANTPRVSQIWISGGRYTFTQRIAFPFSNGTLFAYDNTANGRWLNAPASDNVLAIQQWNAGDGYDFFCDVITDPNPGTRNPSADMLAFFM